MNQPFVEFDDPVPCDKCGRSRHVCCAEGSDEGSDFSVHKNPVCVDCCRAHSFTDMVENYVSFNEMPKEAKQAWCTLRAEAGHKYPQAIVYLKDYECRDSVEVRCFKVLVRLGEALGTRFKVRPDASCLVEAPLSDGDFVLCDICAVPADPGEAELHLWGPREAIELIFTDLDVCSTVDILDKEAV